MIDALGPFILVLIFTDYRMGGLTAIEMPDFDSCQAAIAQLSVDPRITGYCIAKDLQEGTPND